MLVIVVYSVKGYLPQRNIDADNEIQLSLHILTTKSKISNNNKCKQQLTKLQLREHTLHITGVQQSPAEQQDLSVKVSEPWSGSGQANWLHTTQLLVHVQ